MPDQYLHRFKNETSSTIPLFPRQGKTLYGQGLTRPCGGASENVDQQGQTVE